MTLAGPSSSSASSSARSAARLGWFLNNRLGAQEPRRRASSRRRSLQRSAAREAENLKRQQIVEARDQILSEKSKADSDLRSRKGQVAKRERDLKQLQDGLAEIEAENQRQREAVARDGKELAAREAELARGPRRLWSSSSRRKTRGSSTPRG